MFDHYIFQTEGGLMEHVPMDARGPFATMTPANARSLPKYLQDSLRRQQAAADKSCAQAQPGQQGGALSGTLGGLAGALPPDSSS